MGCRCGMTCWNRLRDWQAAGVWDKVHTVLLAHLRRADKIDFERFLADTAHVRAVGGGEETGPSPVDRSKPGSKHAVLTDGKGVPLVVDTLPANRPDFNEAVPLLDAVPPIAGKPGHPRKRPDHAMGDRGFDDEEERQKNAGPWDRPRVGQAADAPRQWPRCVSLGRGANHQLVSSVPPVAGPL